MVNSEELLLHYGLLPIDYCLLVNNELLLIYYCLLPAT